MESPQLSSFQRENPEMPQKQKGWEFQLPRKCGILECCVKYRSSSEKVGFHFPGKQLQREICNIERLCEIQKWLLRKWDFTSQKSSFRWKSLPSWKCGILKCCVRYRNSFRQKGDFPRKLEMWNIERLCKNRSGFWESGISVPRKAALYGNPFPAGNVESWNVVWSTEKASENVGFQFPGKNLQVEMWNIERLCKEQKRLQRKWDLTSQESSSSWNSLPSSALLTACPYPSWAPWGCWDPGKRRECPWGWRGLWHWSCSSGIPGIPWGREPGQGWWPLQRHQGCCKGHPLSLCQLGGCSSQNCCSWRCKINNRMSFPTAAGMDS